MLCDETAEAFDNVWLTRSEWTWKIQTYTLYVPMGINIYTFSQKSINQTSVEPP